MVSVLVIQHLFCNKLSLQGKSEDTLSSKIVVLLISKNISVNEHIIYHNSQKYSFINAKIFALFMDTVVSVSVSVSAERESYFRFQYRFRPRRKKAFSACFGFGRNEKKSFGRSLSQYIGFFMKYLLRVTKYQFYYVLLKMLK